MDDSGGFFEGVGQDWLRFYDQLRTSVRVLVVDDEPLVYEVVEAILEGAGYQVEVAETAEDAWERILKRSYGLLVADKNLPGMSGVELISKLKAAGIDLPSLMITGYASVESISHALAAGASDYITKPFDNVDHVRRRAMSIVDRGLLAQLYERIVRDLTETVSEGGVDRDRVRQIGSELFAFKQALHNRPDLLLVAAEGGQSAELAEALRRAGLAVRHEHSPEAARAALAEPDAPVAAVVSLQLRFPVSLVADLRQIDPLLAVVVTSLSPRLVDALAAVEAGACDFFLQAIERLEALEIRARRAVETSRRARLYLQLIAILRREATGLGHRIATGIVEALPEDHREFLLRASAEVSEPPAEIDVDLSDLFDESADPSRGERRRHRRISTHDVEVWFRPARTELPFARGWLRDLSRGGFFLRTSPLIEQGVELETHLLVSGDLPAAAIRLTGRVVRTEWHDPDPHGLSGSGVLVAEDEQELLSSLVERLAVQAG